MKTNQISFANHTFFSEGNRGRSNVKRGPENETENVRNAFHLLFRIISGMHEFTQNSYAG